MILEYKTFLRFFHLSLHFYIIFIHTDSLLLGTFAIIKIQLRLLS